MVSPVKTSELPPQTSMGANDSFVVLHDPSGIPTTSLISLTNLMANVSVSAVFNANVTVSSNATLNASNLTTANLVSTYHTTPVTSGDVVGGGKIWADANYIYVAVANNQIKRVALSSF